MDRKRVLFFALAYAALVSPVSARAKTGVTIVIPYPIRLDGRTAGEIPVTMTPDGALLLNPQDVAAALAEEADAKTNAALAALGTAPHPLGTFGDGVSVTLDQATQELAAELAAGSRPPRSVRLTAPDVAVPEAELEKQAKVSAYLNLFPNIEMAHRDPGGETGLQDIVGATDGAVRLFGEKGFTIEGSGSFAGNAEHPFVRIDTRLVYDRPERLMRFTAGDLNYAVDGFQESLPMGGVSVSSEFGLQPNRIFRPTGRRSVLVERESDVDVYVNGAPLKTLSLKPGRYELSDFPYALGNNDVEIVVKDRSGREERLRFGDYQDFDLLAPAAGEYSYNFGALSTPDGADIAYDTEDVAFSGFHRLGVTDALTLSANAQGTKDVQGGGGGALLGTKFGLFGTDSAVSRSEAHGSGVATSFRYRYLTPERRRADDATERRLWGVSNMSYEMRATYYSARYVGLSDVPGTAAWSVNPSFSASVTEDGSLFVSAEYDKMRKGGDARGATFGAVRKLRDGLSLQGQIRYYDDGAATSDGGEVAVFLSVVYRPGERGSVTASYNTDRRQTALDYDYSGGDKVGALEGEAGIAYGEADGDADIRAGIDYIGNRYEANFRTDTDMQEFDTGSVRWRSNLRLGTALVFADGAASMGRPVFDSFAIVRKHRTAKDAEILIDADKDGYRAKTDRMGPAVVPDLFPYYPNAIRTEALNLPAGYDVGKGKYDVLPSYKSGYKLEFGSAYAVTVIGRLDEASARRVGTAAGRIHRPDGDPSFVPVLTFVNAKGRFAAGGLRPGRHEIRFMTNPPLFAPFTIKDDGKTLARLDNLPVYERSAAKAAP
jgi:outer membrane usher protein